MDTVLECHSRLAALLGAGAESVNVLRRAEEHRRYWRPARVKVVLLAESHVYTTSEELARTISLPASAPADLPRGFVRLVYCLGYGENRLLSRSIESPANSGTPQFWKIFYSCVNPVATNSDFTPIQAATSPAQRISNKLLLLKTLQKSVASGCSMPASRHSICQVVRRQSGNLGDLPSGRLGSSRYGASSKPRLPLIWFASARGSRELSGSASRISVCPSPSYRSRTHVSARPSTMNHFWRITAWFVRPTNLLREVRESAV